jgi:hypothetical protein
VNDLYSHIGASCSSRASGPTVYDSGFITNTFNQREMKLSQCGVELSNTLTFEPLASDRLTSYPVFIHYMV